ncbi:MAG: ATP-binding cassette domain-containing protein [Thermodesulfobacteriota bacterium]
MSMLETRNICFAYPNRTVALQGVDFTAGDGEFIGILGANGSGKTTLLKILNGLLKPTAGEVRLNGENINSGNKNLLFTRICTMFQNPDNQLFSPTVGEDVAFGPANMGLSNIEIERRTEYALDSVEMSEFADKAIHNLSHGQKKRICLAGVLAISPEVILLDEPTASLDPMGVSCIMHLLKDLNREKNITMIMATHSVDLVPVFIDRVVILNEGKIIREGLPEEVFSDAEMIRRAKLKLPRIGQLFEILKKQDGFDIDSLPLTIGEARGELVKLFTFGRGVDLISDAEQNI